MGAVHVEVEDTTTDHCSTSFKVLIVCPQFEGKPLLQRHRFWCRLQPALFGYSCKEQVTTELRSPVQLNPSLSCRPVGEAFCAVTLVS
ncbi:UNVERIFIED_CONTAM: hypothetical protein FKN15_018666 [Acipenser sinensis]